MKKTIDFGKINYTGSGKRYPARVTIELKERGGEETFRMINGEKQPTGEKTPTYTELSICGEIWNTKHTDIVCGGQCLDTMAEYIKSPIFKTIYKWWKAYHLNGMHAGTPEQEKAITEWENAGNKYEYTAVCEMLKDKGLYEIPFTGKTIGKVYNNELYKYGHGWVIWDIPKNDLEEIKEFLSK